MAQYDINLREYWRILKKRKFVVIGIAISLGAFSTLFGILRTPTPLYTTVSLIEIQKAPVVEGLYNKTISWSDSDDIETQMTVIKSYAVFQKVAEKMGLLPRSDLQGDKALKAGTIPIIESLQSKVEITREKFSSVLRLKVTDTSPAFAQRLANTIAQTYRDIHAEQQMKRTTEALKYIDEQQKEVREKLREAEDDFNRFSKDNELISVDIQSEKLLGRGQEIQADIRKLGEEKAELQELLWRLNAFIANPSGAERDFFSAKAGSRYQSTNEALVGLLLKRETLLKEYTPKHPEVVAISDEIIENASKMALNLQQQVKGLEKREIDLSKELEILDTKTKMLLDRKLEHNRLKRKVDLYTDMIALLERKNQEAMIRRAEKPEEVNIVKPALLPAEPINPPNTATTGAMGVIVGIVFGLVVALVVETFDTSLGAIEDVEKTLETQVLGVVPQTDPRDVQESLTEKVLGGLKEHASKYAVSLISHYVPKSMMAESFRALRTNIEFKDVEKKLKTLVVTSTSPQEGKTLIATNLAIIMAQAGKRTLLVGSDLRKPSLGRIFGVESSPGVTDILLGNYPWRDTVKTVTDLVMGAMTFEEVLLTPGLDNLHLITGGSIPPNPAELLDSARFMEFMEEAKAEYDILIFDTPPILSAADAVILGTKADGVLLIYRIGAVSRRLLSRAAAQIEQVKSRILGVILNGMRPDVSPDFEDYKHYKYYYSYGEEGKPRRHREKRRIFPFVEIMKKASLNVREILKPERTKRPQRQRGKKPSAVIMSLALAAAACLGFGLLYQNGVIDPFGLSTTQNPTKKRVELPAPAKEEPSPPPPKEPEARVDKSSKRLEEKAEPVPRPSLPEPPASNTPQPEEKISSENKVSAPILPRSERKQPASPKEESSGKPAPPVTAAVPISPPTAVAKGDTDKPVLIEDTAMYPFSLYQGSVPNLDLAKRALSKNSKKGISPYYVKVQLSRGERYRIYAGCFESKEKAEAFKQEKGLTNWAVKQTPYANLVGIYGAPYELEKKIERLKDLDYAPYVVKDSEGKSRLYVGAFVPPDRAKRQYEELKAAGIDNQIVKR